MQSGAFESVEPLHAAAQLIFPSVMVLLAHRSMTPEDGLFFLSDFCQRGLSTPGPSSTRLLLFLHTQFTKSPKAKPKSLSSCVKPMAPNYQGECRPQVFLAVFYLA